MACNLKDFVDSLFRLGTMTPVTKDEEILKSTIKSKRVRLKYLTELLPKIDWKIKKSKGLIIALFVIFIALEWLFFTYAMDTNAKSGEEFNRAIGSAGLIISIGIGVVIPLVICGLTYCFGIGSDSTIMRIESEKEIFNICEYLMIYDEMSHEEEKLYITYSTVPGKKGKRIHFKST